MTLWRLALVWWAIGALGTWYLLCEVEPNVIARGLLSLIWPVFLPLFGFMIAIESDGEGIDDL